MTLDSGEDAVSDFDISARQFLASHCFCIQKWMLASLSIAYNDFKRKLPNSMNPCLDAPTCHRIKQPAMQSHHWLLLQLDGEYSAGTLRGKKGLCARTFGDRLDVRTTFAVTPETQGRRSQHSYA